jgi:hypothetical protein
MRIFSKARSRTAVGEKRPEWQGFRTAASLRWIADPPTIHVVMNQAADCDSAVASDVPLSQRSTGAAIYTVL